ncbi:MAG: membrane protein insertase YidC [Pseudomonadota bacterium]
MDNQRLFLYAGLGLMLMLIWQTWQLDYHYVPPVADTVDATQSAGATGDAAVNDDGALPSNVVPSAGAAPTVNTATEAPEGQWVRVRTDLLNIEFDSRGANPVLLELLDYPEALETPTRLVRVFEPGPARVVQVQSGLQARTGQGTAPTHQDIYRSTATEFELGTSDTLEVPFTWSEDGVDVTKTWVFTRDKYGFEVVYDVVNNSDAPWQGWHYGQLMRSAVGDDASDGFIRSYTGGVLSTPAEVYEKIDLEDIAEKDVRVEADSGWVAMIQHYFGAALIPEQGGQTTFYSNYVRNTDRYILGAASGVTSLQPGESAQFRATVYAGPKIQDRLESYAENLRLTVDFGYLTVLAQPLFWLLNKIHGFVGNWGWSIVLLTVLIKAFFYKLSEMGYKSMARMKALQPKMVELKERYGDNREKMGQATMELYKKEKVNPLGSCFPMLIQIPVFIALYWMLIESVELRQAPWLLWIEDLAAKDPYFVLPVLMGISMFVQQKLNPAPVDPIQQKVFMIMPWMFMVFFMFFPAGLVLYWIVNNVLSIAQQWYITRVVIGETSTKPA